MSDKALSRAELLAAETRRFEEVAVPGIGILRIASVTGAEWEEWRKTLSIENHGEVMARLIIMSAVDESGNRQFVETDLPALMLKDLSVLRTLGSAIIAFNSPKD